MKKILYSLGALLLTLSATSCMEVDNFDEPEAHFTGRIIDSTTGQNILASQGECKVRLYEKSFSLNPAPQDIPLKQDGTFNNTKLFNGTYDVELRGAWWPQDMTRVPIGGTVTREFTVTPYLRIVDFTMEYVDGFLEVSCRLDAPIKEGLPRIMDLKPFLSLNQFCGSNQCIDPYNTKDEYKVEIRSSWDRIPKAEDGLSQPYSFKLEVKPGYTYFVRMGAYVDDDYHCYNYSEIKKIEIPAE